MTSGETPKAVSRQVFIKGVIAGGAAVASANYLFRGSSLLGQTQSAGLAERLITINVNGQQRRVDAMKQETLAWTLRYTSWVSRARSWDVTVPNAAPAQC